MRGGRPYFRVRRRRHGHSGLEAEAFGHCAKLLCLSFDLRLVGIVKAPMDLDPIARAVGRHGIEIDYSVA